VSRQLRILEEALGTALFVRQGRGLALTPAGRQLQEATDAVFDPLRTRWAELRRRQDRAPLVLGCPGSVLARWMIPRLERLAGERPGLQLHLSASESTPDAQLTGLDAALLIADGPWPAGWQVHELAPERIGPVISPRHPAFERLRSAGPEALSLMPLLHTESRPQAWREWAVRADVDGARLQMGTGFDHLYYLLEAAVAGLGVAIAPEPLVAEDLASGRLAALWGFVETDARWVLCTPRGRENRNIAPLAEWLRKELARPL
jgi:DNA-binding transcriptional LysR family regulator